MRQMIFALILICTFATCKTSKTSTELTNSAWRCEAIKTAEGNQTLPTDAPITIRFADNNVSGNAPCNLYNGTYRIASDSIKFSAMMTTKRACMFSKLEMTYLQLLNEAQTQHLKGKKLIITSKSGQLIFVQ